MRESPKKESPKKESPKKENLEKEKKVLETKASYTLVGGFVIAFFVGLVGAVVWLSDLEFDEEVARYHILFDGAVTGLRVGNPVRYRGIPVGIVTEMEINPQNVEQVRVMIEVSRTTPIKENAEASLEFQGLTGVGFVQIQGGTQEAPNLVAGPGEDLPVIPSAPSAITEVLEQAPELLGRFIALVDRGNDILSDQNRRNITETLANVTELTGALAEASDDLQRLLREGGDTMAQFKDTAAEAEVLVAAFATRAESIAALSEKTLLDANSLIVESETLIDKAGPALDQTTIAMRNVNDLAEELAPQISPLVESTQLSLDEFNAIAGDLRLATQNIGRAADEAANLLKSNEDSLSEFANTGLYEFTQLLGETRGLVQVLTRVSTELERDPARFLFGDQNQGFEAR